MTNLQPNNSHQSRANTPKPQSENSISSSDNYITAFIKFLLSSTESSHKFRRSFMYIGISFLFLWSLVLTVMLTMRPEKISIGDFNLEKGKLTLQDEHQKLKKIIMILSPNGSVNNAWVNPEIQVKQGQKIKINAAGKIHLALSRLVKSAEDDVRNRIPWNDPDGVIGRGATDPWYPQIATFKIMPNQPFGKLIAAIKQEDGSYQYEPIGRDREFEVQEDGELLLTINDIWLSPENKDAYLPPEPTTTNQSYYRQKVLASINSNQGLATQTTEEWTREKWDEKINEEYRKRLIKWEEISHNELHSLWYDDNVGSFSITIAIE